MDQLLKAEGAAVYIDQPGEARVEGYSLWAGSSACVIFNGDEWKEEILSWSRRLTESERRRCHVVPCEAGQPRPFQRTHPLNALLQMLENAWLPTALESRTLTPYLQPVLDLRTERVIGFESLVRFRHADGVKSAFDIIRAARAYEQIALFDIRSREAALFDGYPQLLAHELLFVNYMPDAEQDPDEALADCLDTALLADVPLKNIVFEFVESESHPDISSLQRIARGLQEEGAKVAIDDLGSGHSALAYIDHIQPNIIKLDRSLLNLQNRKASRILLEGIVEYAHDAGIEVVIEGIETIEQLRLSQEIGAEMGQGWLIGKPLDHPERRPGFRVQVV